VLGGPAVEQPPELDGFPSLPPVDPPPAPAVPGPAAPVPELPAAAAPPAPPVPLAEPAEQTASGHTARLASFSQIAAQAVARQGEICCTSAYANSGCQVAPSSAEVPMA
jgi:hypothetical protein